MLLFSILITRTGYNPSSHAAVRSVASHGRSSNTNAANANSGTHANDDHKHSDSDAETSLRSNKNQPLKVRVVFYGLLLDVLLLCVGMGAKLVRAPPGWPSAPEWHLG